MKNKPFSQSKIRHLLPYQYILAVLLFILIDLFIIRLNITNASLPIHFFNMNYDRISFCGVLTQIQVFILVCLVVRFSKLGYITTFCLSTYSIIGNIFCIIRSGDASTLTGIVFLIGAITTCTIIYYYGKRLKKQMNDLTLQQQTLNQLAFYDPLTGLVNRRKILQLLDEQIASATFDTHFSVVFIDLDNFKKVNDLAGHQIGDKLLKEVSACCNNCLHTDDYLGRIGGDEFALIINHPLTTLETLEYVETLRKTLIKRFSFKDINFSVSASFGIAHYPEDASTSEQLLKYADTAMYAAKSTGKNKTCFFTADMHKYLLEKIQLEDALRTALTRHEFFLVYQPQYHIETGTLKGVEALIRWHAPKYGIVSPDQFIPLAEETGLIIRIGEWVLQEACRTFLTLRETCEDAIKLSINISTLQLQDKAFIPFVTNLLKETQFPPHQLIFEITESILIVNPETVINTLNTLKTIGIQIALDDFGTNYASLSYLQRLPLDILKIDRSFITSMTTSHLQCQIVYTIIDISKNLNYEVIAEGVETNEQLALLKAHHCDYIQGYLWGKPVTFNELQDLLQSSHRPIHNH